MHPMEVFHLMKLQDLSFFEGVPEHLRPEIAYFKEPEKEDSNAEVYCIAYINENGVITFKSPENYNEKKIH